MNTKLTLLTYTTRFGSTQEVAEAITTTLRSNGLEVEIQPMQDVKSLAIYDAVVLGTAIYGTKWHPVAHQFLSQHQETLKQRPVAIFALGPLNNSHLAMQRSRQQFDRELKKYPWFKPVTSEVFVGKLDPTKLNFFERLGATASDNRDWEAIRTWAIALPAQLQHREVVQPA